MTTCLNCGCENDKPKFCSRSCSVTYNNKKSPKRKRTGWDTAICNHCSVEFDYKKKSSTGKFCSNKCSAAAKRQGAIDKWKVGELNHTGQGYVPNGVRAYLLEVSGGKCSLCGWSGTNIHTGRTCLEVDHIDDDPFNHAPENLQVVCPNCHAQKTLPPQKSNGGRYSKNKQHPKFCMNK